MPVLTGADGTDGFALLLDVGDQKHVRILGMCELLQHMLFERAEAA